MTKCQARDCESEATHFPVLNIKVETDPLKIYPPCELLLGVEACLPHAEAYPVEMAYFSHPKELIEKAAKGQCPPLDYANAYITAEPMESEKGKVFVKMKNDRSQDITSFKV